MAYTSLPVGSSIVNGIITIPVGNVAIEAGNLKLRVKAQGGNNAGNVLTNTTAFTFTEDIPEYEGYYAVHNFDTDNITVSTSGSDTVLMKANNLVVDSVPSTALQSSLVTEAPKLVLNAINGYSAIQIDASKKATWSLGQNPHKPLTFFFVAKLLTELTGYKYAQYVATAGFGYAGLQPFAVGDNNTVLLSSASIVVNQYHVIAVQFNSRNGGAINSANGKIFLNTSKVADGAVGDIDSQWMINLYESAGNTAHYELAEIRLVNTDLTEPQIQAIITELMTKYAIS